VPTREGRPPRPEMRALTVWQPWAACIACRGKRAENRVWPFPPALAGQLIAIHAGKMIVQEPVAVPCPEGLAGLFDSHAEQDRWQAWRLGLARRPGAGQWPRRLVLGAVVAAAVVTGCHCGKTAPLTRARRGRPAASITGSSPQWSRCPRRCRAAARNGYGSCHRT